MTRISRLLTSLTTEAAPGRRKKKGQLKPDQYRQQHGRCPKGYRFDGERCQPIADDPQDDAQDDTSPDDAQEVAPDAEPKPKADKPKADKPKAPKSTKKSKKKTDKTDEPAKPSAEQYQRLREQREAAERDLEDLFERDMGQYLKKVDEYRASGVLPDRETAEKIVEIDDWRDLPEETLRDPRKLDDIMQQQAAQRQHEQRVLQHRVEVLEQFEHQRELALQRGEKPHRISVLKMLDEIEQQMGRPLSERDKKKAQEVFEASNKTMEQAWRRGETAVDPGGWLQRFKETMERFVAPKWRHRLQTAAYDAKLSEHRDEPTWNLGFPPYDQDRTPRRHLPGQTRNRGFPPFRDGQDQGAVRPEYRLAPEIEVVLDRAPIMRGFPPYDKAPEPAAPDNVGLPPYNAKSPRTSYLPDKVVRPGFPPYQDGVYRVRP